MTRKLKYRIKPGRKLTKAKDDQEAALSPSILSLLFPFLSIYCIFSEMVAEWCGRNSPDCLSSLPDLCLLNVFSHLKRNDLWNMRFVNSKMKKISNDKSLDRIKWHYMCLEIMQTKRGYGFDAKLNCQEYPTKTLELEWDASYRYEVYKAANGECIEERITNGPDLEWVEQAHSPHDWPVPDCLISALATITRHHEVCQIGLTKIPFDAGFFDKLNVVLTDHKITNVHCSGTDGQPISHATRMSFAHLINNARYIDLSYGCRSVHLASLISEEFIREIRECGTQPKTVVLQCRINPVEVQQFRFYPTVDILRHIVLFDRLDAPHMVLRVRWLPLLFKGFTEARRCLCMAAEWRVSIDRPIDPDQFAQWVSDDFEFCTIEHRGVDVHFFERKRDRRIVEFQVDEHPVAGQEPMLVLTVQCN